MGAHANAWKEHQRTHNGRGDEESFAAGYEAFRDELLSRNTDTLFGGHVGEYLTLRCMPDLAASGVYPNAKELTESMAAYAAVRKYLTPHIVAFRDPSVLLIAVGDGSTPRTAAMFALRSRWHCMSIDPVAKQRVWRGDHDRIIERLEIVPTRIEDIAIKHAGPVVIAAVHSHARLEATLASIIAPAIHIVAMPCCVPLRIRDVEPVASYADPHCWSAHRRVVVWANVKGAAQ